MQKKEVLLLVVVVDWVGLSLRLRIPIMPENGES